MPPPPPVVELPFVRVDLTRRVIHRQDGGQARLTTVETSLLRYLLDREGQVVTREQLLAEVWGYSSATYSRTCDTAIRRLRLKIELDPAAPECLLTVHGGGYTLSARASADRPAPGSRPEPAAGPAPVASPPGRTPPRRVPLGSRIVDLGRAQVEGPEGAIPLTAREIGLLELLLAAEGLSVDRDALQRRVWGSTAGRALHNAMSRLRRKLEPAPGAPRYLLTTASGYRLAIADPGADPPERAAARARTALPAEVDARFGRQADLEAIARRFSAGDRLVTLIGPGGAGKSRLALAAADRISARRPAIWVDLAEARTVDRLIASVAVALQMQLGSGDPVSGAADALRALGPALVVLDNVEQLIPHASDPLGAWLARAPEIWLLATSRIPLGIRGERRLAVGALDPDDAVALFVDRAPRPPDPADPELRALVEDLGRMPLAIELVASRTSALGLRELRARLSDQLELLALSDRRRPARHRSLRACLDATFALLSPAARAAFPALGVFAGRFDLDAAEGVLEGGGGHEVVDWIQELVEAGLVTAEAETDEFLLAPHVQEYALERLGADRATCEARHWRTCAALGQPAALAALDGPGEAEARLALARQFDNLARAVEGALAAGDGPSAVFAASAAWEVVGLAGPYRLALGWVEPLLALPLEDELQARCRLLVGRIRRAAGLLAPAEQALREAARIAEALGSAEIGAQAHLELAALGAGPSRAAHAEGGSADLALGLARGIDSRVLVCRALGATGRDLLRQHRIRDAHEVLWAALLLADDLGARRREAEIRRWLGVAIDRLGRLAEAKRELRRAARIAGDLGDRRLEAEILLELGRIGAEQGLGWGLDSLEEAARQLEAIGDRRGLAEALVSVVIHRINNEEFERAEETLDRVEAIARAIGANEVQAQVCLRRGVLARLLGRLDEAERLFDEAARSEHEAIGRSSRAQRGWCLLSRGDVDSARRIWREAEAEAVAVGDLFNAGNAGIWLGVAERTRDLDAAVACWDRAAALGRAHDLLTVALHGTGNATCHLLDEGRLDEGLERLQRLEALDVSGSPKLALSRAIYLGAAEVALGRDAAGWLAEADRLAELHFGGLAQRAHRELLRRKIAVRAEGERPIRA